MRNFEGISVIARFVVTTSHSLFKVAKYDVKLEKVFRYILYIYIIERIHCQSFLEYYHWDKVSMSFTTIKQH
jgi:hypothetical protein